MWGSLRSLARKLRVEYPGAVYLVMSRSDRRERIFRDDADRQRFVNTLGEACGKTGWQLHALCLTPPITFIWWWKHRGGIWWRG